MLRALQLLFAALFLTMGKSNRARDAGRSTSHHADSRLPGPQIPVLTKVRLILAGVMADINGSDMPMDYVSALGFPVSELMPDPPPPPPSPLVQPSALMPPRFAAAPSPSYRTQTTQTMPHATRPHAT